VRLGQSKSLILIDPLLKTTLSLLLPHKMGYLEQRTPKRMCAVLFAITLPYLDMDDEKYPHGSCSEVVYKQLFEWKTSYPAKGGPFV
jgi:hypothetical protein